jgi:hypothetical protein
MIVGGHVRAARQYQGCSIEVFLAQVSNDEGKQVVFSRVPAEANFSVSGMVRSGAHWILVRETPVIVDATADDISPIAAAAKKVPHPLSSKYK